MRLLVGYIVLALVFVSCEEPFKLDNKQAPPRIVIDGLVTDKPSQQSVKVSRSANFYSQGKTERITHATVTVSDNTGNVFNFVHNPGGNEDSVGIYLPAIPFVGEVGKTYSLRVEVDGEVFEASDRLADIIPIDSLAFEVNEDEQEDPEVEGRFFDLLVFATENTEEKNFFLFKFFRNDSLLYQNDTDIYYSDDELLAENIDGVSGPLYYKKGDVAKVEAYSLSRQGFVYYNDLASLLNGDAGGMFGPIPSSPRTNLSNNALGFFQVSAVKWKELKLE